MPPLNIASSSSAGANTGSFSIGGLNFTPTAQATALTSNLPLLAAIVVGGIAAVMYLKK